MKNVLFATLAACALIGTPAVAADIPVKAPRAPQPAWSWAGSYFGVHAGAVWGDVDRFYPDAIGGPLTLTSKIDDAIIGIHGGTQWQFGQIVLGIESAFSFGADQMEGTALAPTPPFTTDLSVRHRITHLSTIGGRAGFAFDSFLFYGSGGFASGKVIANYFTTSTGLERFPTFSGRANLTGWYAGGGIDWVVFRSDLTSLILGVEYQHFELDSKHIPIADTTVAEQYTAGATGDIVRARLTVKYPTWWNR
jgi:outer membrane immunogenic protein